MKRRLVLALCALMIALVPVVVSARSHPGALGRATLQPDTSCFGESAGILRNFCTAAGGKTWSVPIIWDTPTPGNKSISVSAHKSAAGSIFSCVYIGLNATGGIVSNVNFPAFTVAGFSTKSVTITNVPGGSFGEVFCTIGPSQTAGMVGINYLQP